MICDLPVVHIHEARNTCVRERERESCLCRDPANPVTGTGEPGRSELAQAAIVVNVCFAETLSLLLRDE